MAHAQKPDFVFRRNGRVHLNRRGASVQSTTGSRGVRISGSDAGYIMFRGRVKSTGYPLHSPLSPSLPLPCITVCHHISTRLYSRVWSVPMLILTPAQDGNGHLHTPADLHNKQLNDLYSSPNIVRAIKIEKNEMGGACGSYGGEERRIQGFGGDN